MRATGWVLMSSVLALLAFAGCGDGGKSGSSPGCTPGATQACVCAGGVSGGQACASDGSRWLACDCTGGSVGPDGGTTPDGGGGGTAEAFVLVEPGTFTMGSPESEKGRQSGEVQHEVTLTGAFYLQATEVTQGQWRALMNNNPSDFATCGDDDCPVETVNWWEAAAYANARSAQEGLPECYTLEACSEVSPGNDMECDGVSVNASDGDPYQCIGYRLPTEAEWEYAYRAGTTTAYYDPNLDAIGWYGSNSRYTTHSVGEKAPNAWGLYDMAGNVWEWCWDRYGAYPSNGVTNPTGSGKGSDRVRRGGSWNFVTGDARAALRYYEHPDYRSGDLGFRLARSAP